MKSKILYIDDDFNNGVLIQRILEAEGYQVVLAPNGSLGLAQAHRECPDLILLDIYMPDLNGHEVVHRLRQTEQTKNIPIVVISASLNPSDKQLSLQAGCIDYITKPIDVDLFSSQIKTYLYTE